MAHLDRRASYRKKLPIRIGVVKRDDVRAGSVKPGGVSTHSGRCQGIRWTEPAVPARRHSRHGENVTRRSSSGREVDGHHTGCRSIWKSIGARGSERRCEHTDKAAT